MAAAALVARACTRVVDEASRDFRGEPEELASVERKELAATQNPRRAKPVSEAPEAALGEAVAAHGRSTAEAPPPRCRDRVYAAQSVYRPP